MTTGPAHGRAHHLGTRLDHDVAHDLRRVVDRALDAAAQRAEHDAVGLEQVVLLAGVEPPALDPRSADLAAVVEQPLHRIGDLELATVRRLDAAGGVEDRRGEQVDADQREVAGRIRGLLDQAHDPAGVVELDDAEARRVLHALEQHLGVGPVGARTPRRARRGRPR
jgi:hypothetical protein